jgi:hypothetical protein
MRLAADLDELIATHLAHRRQYLLHLYLSFARFGSETLDIQVCKCKTFRHTPSGKGSCHKSPSGGILCVPHSTSRRAALPSALGWRGNKAAHVHGLRSDSMMVAALVNWPRFGAKSELRANCPRTPKRMAS